MLKMWNQIKNIALNIKEKKIYKSSQLAYILKLKMVKLLKNYKNSFKARGKNVH